MRQAPSRRQVKVARVIKESVSDSIANRLSDPRIKGFVSVIRVDTSPDLRSADVYLSIMADSDSDRRKTFRAIQHAERHIQSLLGSKMTSKYCPHLHFKEDENFKKTLETMRLIEEARKELDDGRDEIDPDGQDEEVIQ